MTDFEIYMVLIGVLGLPIALINLIVTLLTYLDKRYEKRK